MHSIDCEMQSNCDQDSSAECRLLHVQAIPGCQWRRFWHSRSMETPSSGCFTEMMTLSSSQTRLLRLQRNWTTTSLSSSRVLLPCCEQSCHTPLSGFMILSQCVHQSTCQAHLLLAMLCNLLSVSHYVSYLHCRQLSGGPQLAQTTIGIVMRRACTTPTDTRPPACPATTAARCHG